MQCTKCGGEINFGSEAGVAWTDASNIRHITCPKQQEEKSENNNEKETVAHILP